MPAEQVAIKRIILVIEEGRRPPIATLGHMVGMPREDGAGEASHAAMDRAMAAACQISALSP
jgi:hypothetical protein